MADGRTTITTRVKRVTWFTAPLLQTQLLPEPVMYPYSRDVSDDAHHFAPPRRPTKQIACSVRRMTEGIESPQRGEPSVRQTSMGQPVSAALAAALAMRPAILKFDWHLLGEELSCTDFAYLVSFHLASHPELSSRSQEELLAGAAELFAEATVMQADKSRIGWRAFSQALVSATLAAGPPPTLITTARLTSVQMAIEGPAPEKRSGENGVPTGPRGRRDTGGLVISPELSIHYLPKPMCQLLICESPAGALAMSASNKVSLWQLNDASSSSTPSLALSNVLLDNAPLTTCVALVPTHRTPKQEISVAAAATGLSIVAGSKTRSLLVWVLAAPPGSSSSNRRYSLNASFSLSLSAPLTALVAASRSSGTPLLFGGLESGAVVCWDVTSWTLKAKCALAASYFVQPTIGPYCCRTSLP